MRTNTRTDDIDNQNVANYSYDLNGRLISDLHDGVTLIKWSKSDKVLEVHKPNGTLTIKYNALDQKVSQSTSRNDSIVTEYFVYDPSGNVLASYGDTVASGNHMFALKQLMIYGSSRVGVLEADVMLWSQIGNATPEIATIGNIFSLKLGQKRYELSNHLGNVTTVVSDRKLVDSHSGGQITSWKADVISVTDYYAFGMKITERTWSSDSYRFGFNGKDFFSDWNRQDYGFRIYDPRKCRFESTDPLHGEYPWNSTYAFAENSPIESVDLDGLERPNERGFMQGGYFIETTAGTSSLGGGDTGSKGLSVTNQQNVDLKLQSQANMKAMGLTPIPTGDPLGAPMKQFKVQQTYVSQTQPKKHEVVPTFTNFEKGMIIMNSIINGVTMFGGGGKMTYKSVFPYKVSKTFNPSAFRSVYNDGQFLSNGVYRLDNVGMAIHLDGNYKTGKSQFKYGINTDKLILDGAKFADKYGLWTEENSAKVRVTDGIIGYSKGEPTEWFNIYRSSKNMVHGAPTLTTNLELKFSAPKPAQIDSLTNIKKK